MSLSITILGSGTSVGVPMIGCHCPVCSSTDPHDKRTRPSIVVHYSGKSVLVDTSPELRLQAIANRLDLVHAVVFTHAHADHIFGLDDVRRYNTLLNEPLPLHASAKTLEQLKKVFAYAFDTRKDPDGYRPELAPKIIDGPFDLFGTTWTPVPLIHGRNQVLGFRIGTFAYCTDCNIIPDESMALLRDLDVLIIDGLRAREHPTHFSHQQALEVIGKLKPKRSFFTHLAHDFSHAELEASLPPHVRLTYDGLRINL